MNLYRRRVLANLAIITLSFIATAFGIVLLGLILSRDSLIIQRMVHSLSVEVCDGLVNASVDVIS